MILTISDLQRFYGVSAATASKIKRTILDSLGKNDVKRITIYDLCSYEKIEFDTAKHVLKTQGIHQSMHC